MDMRLKDGCLGLRRLVRRVRLSVHPRSSPTVSGRDGLSQSFALALTIAETKDRFVKVNADLQDKEAERKKAIRSGLYIHWMAANSALMIVLTLQKTELEQALAALNEEYKGLSRTGSCLSRAGPYGQQIVTEAAADRDWRPRS
ncbi:MAG: hypothetical protein HW405_929 [Candidatus Berkelbacteria bacterium]|nr:hypothetical protein [Candidatus Berkelbacteria bacterium]